MLVQRIYKQRTDMKRFFVVLVILLTTVSSYGQNKTLGDAFLSKAKEAYELANYVEALFLLDKAKVHYADQSNVDVLYLESKTMFANDQTDPKTKEKINQYIALATPGTPEADEVANLLVTIELGDYQEHLARGPIEKVGALSDGLSTSNAKKNSSAEELMQKGGTKKKKSKKETKKAIEDETKKATEVISTPQITTSSSAPSASTVPLSQNSDSVSLQSSSNTANAKVSKSIIPNTTGAEKLYFMPSKDDNALEANVTTSSAGGISPTTQGISKPNVPQTSEPEVLVISSDEVPFKYVENSPILSGCDNTISEVSRKECVSLNINAHVSGNFNAQVGQGLGLSGIQRIYVTFVIDTNGNLTNIQAQGPHPKLEEEARRVLKTLGTFTPGRQDGKPIDVVYSLPIAVGL